MQPLDVGAGLEKMAWEVSHVNSVGVPTTRPGPPFLKSASARGVKGGCLPGAREGAVLLGRVPPRCSLWDVSK